MAGAKWLWSRRFMVLKLLGLGMLVWYLAQHGVGFEPIWVVVYLALALAVAMVHAVVVNPILERFATPERADTGEGGRMLTLALSRPLQTFALIPGEDGLCFVPLLLIGITPLSAAIVAAAFAALHYPDYQLKHCVPKGFICFLVALIVVPHGLVAAVIGHLLLDALAIAGWHFARES